MIWSDYPGVADRFDSKVDRSGACHLWTAQSRAGGRGKAYGIFKLAYPKRRQDYAHRLEMVRKLGRNLEPKEWVLHSCDMPLCVNPDHLELGDQKKNMQDAAIRNRTMRGETHIFAKLTEQNVREIRVLLTVPGVQVKQIGRMYGVHATAIHAIKSGKSWTHVV